LIFMDVHSFLSAAAVERREGRDMPGLTSVGV
jgi:hypothetical protein